MIVSIVYEICLTLLGLLAMPWFLYQLAFRGKYSKSFLKRFGYGFPHISKGNRQLIWVHAVSLGETKAIVPLVKAMKAEGQNPIVVFSVTTETGYAEACKSIPADYHVFLPFDFRWVINPIIKRTQPDLVLLCESDFWYNFIQASKQAGASVALVNGKISERSLKRFQKFPFFTRALFGKIDIFCLQSNLYRTRFEKLGIPPEKMHVTGNMKFDGNYARLPPEQLDAWRKELGIPPQDPILVIGSSHSPEEEQILGVLSHVWKQHPNLRVILVPRHPERFDEVAGILQKGKIQFRRFSQQNDNSKPAQVVLIDAMGILRKCYQLADIAIVAGSYTSKVGGHNIMEPSWYGVPVIYGPYMHTQPDLVDLMKEYQAGLQVPIVDLKSELLSLLQDKSRCAAIGQAGLKLSSDVHGATSKTSETLQRFSFLRCSKC